MTVITATTRLARELGQRYDREQAEAGLISWPTAHILPLNAWLSELWTEWLYSGRKEKAVRLLRPSEERAIWEDIVRSQADNLLLEVPATAETALGAWNLRCGWNLPLDAPEWNDSSDSEVFHIWAGEFARRCMENGWLSNAELGAFVADRIEDGAMSVPDSIEMVGFLELTPVQKRLFESLAGRDVKVTERSVPDSLGDAVRVALIDADREVQAAARWSSRILESDLEAQSPDFRIGVIVPDLGQSRSRIERLFAEEFHPRSRLLPDLDSRRLFNVSLGLPLGEYPIIRAALCILKMNPGDMSGMPVEALGRILRSPFIRGSHAADGTHLARAEWTCRALMDVALRHSREPEVSLAEVIGRAEDDSVSHHCPQLALQLRVWGEAWAALPPSELPSDWAASFSDLLAAIGWPGDGSLTSAEYQTMDVWNELLSELAGLDSVSGRLQMETAVGMLERLASSRLFQPESEPAPVQIMGVFEASGLEFDRLWVTGMHDGAWPGLEGGNPFLPHRLQRRFNLPRSSPDRELEFTRLLTARLLASSPSIVVSFPEREGDSDLRVSPLLQTLPEVAVDDLGLSGIDSYVERLWTSSMMESLEDHNGPPIDDVAPGGGTALFKLQAACGFKAFAELRLRAKALELPEPGLSALDRGQLIHRVLERVWNKLRSHEDLLSIHDDRLKAIVSTTVGVEIHDLSERRRALGKPLFAAIEQARLVRLITELLSLEKKRQPFTVLEKEQSRPVKLGGIDLRIRADRVDRLDSGELVILDYKTGECKPKDWYGSRPDEPQLPIYAVTAYSPVAGVFFGSLKTGKVGFRGLAKTKDIVPGIKPSGKDLSLEETIEEWREVLNQLGEDFRAGKATVDPKSRRNCEYCSFPTLCRINEAGYRETDHGDD